MMSLEAIRELNEDIAANAAKADRTPFVPSSPEVVTLRRVGRLLPNIGYYVPAGWELTEQKWFVDKSGFGREDEPAYTVDAFIRSLRSYVEDNPTHGYAITEEGPFQMYVSAFRRVA